MAKYVVSIANLNKIIPDATPRYLILNSKIRWMLTPCEILFRISPKAWDEKLAQESSNPKLSISPASTRDSEDELSDIKETEQEAGADCGAVDVIVQNSNNHLLNVCQ